MNNKVIQISSFFLCFAFGCTVHRDMTGTYLSAKTPCKVVLNEDSTFQYQYKIEFVYKYSNGIWTQINRNKILLNSSVKVKYLPFVAEEINNRGMDKSLTNILPTILNMPDKDKQYYKLFIFINDKLYTSIHIDSLHTIGIDSTLNSVFFGISADERMPGRFSDTLYTDRYTPKLNSAVNLKVNIDYIDSFFNYRVFNNEVLKFNKRGLKFYNDQNNVVQILKKAAN